MKKLYYILLTSLLFACFTIVFFHKTNLDFNLTCSYVGDKEFRPDAYVVLHLDKDFEQYSKINSRTAKIGSACKSSLNFAKHDYVIVYGRKVKTMYYSLKSTLFDDRSDHYIKRIGRRVLFIEYENGDSTGTFMYQINKDKKLRGFIGA
ncbi:hypothetical protein [Flavobacterium subsaxonicum]|uniref:Lipoprotein n=1 Tax=Flavobacterium subsaxonicum WB 4.1-42 = DSM 21790 TaxID=1121898 RepID=A0A0A2MYP1_9FLAO|nr:hypothetical protein [Flavobacterium subsaxonicum]KGO93340.1 hypothetical protein Q766_08525 [Flavobacterium subsaxonicum WB 4.1-42 = DSM 21790]